LLVNTLMIVFALTLVVGGYLMASSTYDNTIPTLGISEMYRYLPVMVAGALISSFSVERILALWFHQEVSPSWH